MSFFGNSASSAGQSNNATTSSAPATGGLFGSSTPASSSNLFGASSTGAPSFSFGNLGGNTATATSSSGTPATSTNLFGNTASKPAEQKPIFGGTPAGGSTPTTTAASGSSAPLFGGASSTPSSNLFGGAQPAQSTNLFGNKASSTPASTGVSTTPTSAASGAFPAGGLFGSKDNKASTPTTGAPTPQAGNMFGNLAGNSNLFSGGASTSQAPNVNAPGAGVSTPTKAVFSLNSTTPAGAPPIKPAGGLFGNTGTQGTSLFAGGQQAEKKKEGQSTNLFANTGGSQAGTATSQPAPPATATTSLFAGAGQTSSQPSNLFGGAKPAETSTSNLFGPKPAAPAQTIGSAPSAAPAGTTSLFAQQAPKPAEAPSAKPSNPLFGGGAAATTTPTAPASASSLFSGVNKPATPTTTSAPAAPATAQTSGLFSGLNKTSSTAAAPEPPKPQAASMFSGLSKPASGAATTEAAKPASNLFSGAASIAPSVGAANAAATPTSSSATTTAATTSSLFGNTAKTAQPGPGAASTTQPSAAAPSAMGASTVGPPSSMARLKNKTMDEIITRWATDLSKYQKEFKDQAAQVAQWDRLLVENGERIQKLYLDTFEAEKGSREIERQLVGIESQQEELESWLDRYEGEVDSMFAKQIGHGDQLAGPDLEREKTYKLAEKVTERLDDMGRDLTKMIKEINDISGTLSKGNKPDDPLSQIVRVLNGHLSQLQWIDTNAAALQAKVAAAQKERSTIGNHYGGPEQDNVDSFYRSYMGRR
ncbi:Nsp1-like C-terminal region-domain-containing protein [Rostrohypoxylon terebratum]|nr:Nsp1-like C-terminal region-domain-containing protein [Rostrohypoxylon terebratum]